MTLVLTEISKTGIAMAADSALTKDRPLPGKQVNVPRVYTGAKKLFQIPKLKAGISIWEMER